MRRRREWWRSRSSTHSGYKDGPTLYSTLLCLCTAVSSHVPSRSVSFWILLWHLLLPTWPWRTFPGVWVPQWQKSSKPDNRTRTTVGLNWGTSQQPGPDKCHVTIKNQLKFGASDSLQPSQVLVYNTPHRSQHWLQFLAQQSLPWRHTHICIWWCFQAEFKVRSLQITRKVSCLYDTTTTGILTVDIDLRPRPLDADADFFCCDFYFILIDDQMFDTDLKPFSVTTSTSRRPRPTPQSAARLRVWSPEPVTAGLHNTEPFISVVPLILHTQPDSNGMS